MKELYTYTQAAKYVEQQFRERELDLDADGLVPNMYFHELRGHSINLLSTAQAQGDSPLDNEGKKLLAQVQDSLKLFDQQEQQQTSKQGIEDLL